MFTRKIIFAAIVSVFLSVFAFTAFGQVAAPRLNSFMIIAEGPTNPATIPWSGASNVGVGVMQFDGESEQNGQSTPIGEGDGTVVRGAFIGENFGVAAEVFSLDLEIDEAAGGGTFTIDNIFVGGGFQIADMIGLGVGLQKGKESDGGSNYNSTESLPQAGVSLRLGEMFYVGAVTGTMSTERFSGGTTEEFDQDVIRAGVGVQNRDGDSGYHLEVFMQEVGDVDVIGLGNVNQENSSGVTVEVLFSNILIGFEALSTEKVLKVDGTVNEKNEEATVSVGWLPEEGLALVVTADSTEDTELSTGKIQTFNTVVATVGWMF